MKWLWHRDGCVNYRHSGNATDEWVAPIDVRLRSFARFSSPTEPNRHSINCYPRENARQKPRNLKKLEDERQLSLKKGGRAQFTVSWVVQFTIAQLRLVTYLFQGNRRGRHNIHYCVSVCQWSGSRRIDRSGDSRSDWENHCRHSCATSGWDRDKHSTKTSGQFGIWCRSRVSRRISLRSRMLARWNGLVALWDLLWQTCHSVPCKDREESCETSYW